ncbi:TPA: TraY domain-containing protein [Legionella bozemanae]|uniref:Relaxosome protein TraY n=1 Tax=Fluoribacter dumoffii TaxID=463 RepID=A8QYN9_9GAMM|nr:MULTISPECIES: TraY domain-containing protein [Legionellaceae]HAU0297875.1 TraY domain-containing protein [Legionella pneumophila]MCW8485142.1 TraY domain-containing protein [Fluoribacter dumoffii]STP13917.1 conjugal transfer protein TraY [Legionella bozemanae]STP13983.1 conjugal transfer protein TraY [Legionella bozemanae]BAF92636.1 TraY protein [Fluoribacter dumoffii Tex-KL]
MESKSNNKKYPKVYISFQLSEEANKLLSESCMRSGRKKIPEAALRLEDHLIRYRSISELNQTIPNQLEAMDADHGSTSNS